MDKNEKLKNMSAESIYDMLIENIRQNSKLNTLRGYHKGDIIGESKSSRNNSVTVDDFCRSALQQGILGSLNAKIHGLWLERLN